LKKAEDKAYSLHETEDLRYLRNNIKMVSLIVMIRPL